MAEYGYGLAFNAKNNASQNAANEIADMQHADEVRRYNEAMDLKLAQMYGDDLKIAHGTNPYDAAIIQKDGENYYSKIGELRRTYGRRYFTDPQVRAIVDTERNKMMYSPAVMRDVQFKQALDAFNKDAADVAKNPTRYNLKAYNDLKNQFENYRMYGNQYGKEAAGKEGPKPFVYQRPNDFVDETKLAMDLGKSFKAFDRKDLHNGRLNAYEEVPNQKALTEMAMGVYQQHKDQYDQKYTDNGLDPIKGIISEVYPYIGGETFMGYEDSLGNAMRLEDYKTRKAAAMAVPNADIYKKIILDSDNIAPTDEKELSATFGSTPTVRFKGPDGSWITESGNRFYWTALRDKNYRGKDAKGNTLPYQKNGLKIGEGYVLKPVEWGEQNGVLEDAKWFGKQLEVKPEYEDTYELWTGADGKQYLKVKAQTEVNAASDAASRKYNAYVNSTTKQREGAGNNTQVSVDVYQDEAGNLFTLDANGNPVPYQK